MNMSMHLHTCILILFTDIIELGAKFVTFSWIIEIWGWGSASIFLSQLFADWMMSTILRPYVTTFCLVIPYRNDYSQRNAGP